jgi:PKD repeat protein
MKFISNYLPAKLLQLALLIGLPVAAQAQLLLPGAVTVTENFDGMGTSATAALPTGFKLSAGANTSYDGITTSATTRAGGTSGTNAMYASSAGGDYNFGVGVTATSTDRALGFLTNSTSVGSPRHILLKISNSTSATIKDLKVDFAIEKYRDGTSATGFVWQFYSSTDGSVWKEDVNGRQSFAAGAANTVVDPTTPGFSTAKSVTLTDINLAPNGILYLRWSHTGGPGNGQALGLDNLVLTPTLSTTDTPPPATPAATITTTPSSYASPYCLTGTAGNPTLSVAFTTSGTLTGTYQVQLSNAAGEFSANATDNIIGRGPTSPITATIPANTPSGTGYRVRVINDAPLTNGTDNGSNLTINLAPTSNTITVSPAASQTIETTGTGANLVAKAAAPSTFAWYYSTSAAGPFTTAIAGATAATYAVKGADFAGAGTYYVVAQGTTTGCGAVVGTSAPVAITVTAPAPAVPAVTLSLATLPDFGSVAAGAASSPKTFLVSGTNLTGPVTITPATGFEIRTGTQPFACCAIELAPVGGKVNGTVEVRFVPTAAQAYAASISVSTPGVGSQAVAVSGTGVAPVYPATVSTTTLTNITATAATTGGTIEPDGGSPVTARGVVWAKTANPVLGSLKTADGADKGTFTSTITGLVPGTTYYARAYATNSAGTAYGEEFSFTTVVVPLATEPTQSATPVASQVDGTTMQLTLTGGNGTKHLVLAQLGSAVSAVPVDATTYTDNTVFGKGTQFGTTGSYVVYAGTGNTVLVSGLRPNTTYSFSVFDYSDNDTPYAENYLTTAPGTLTQTTLPVPATMLLEENFEYATNTTLTANGWAAHSGGTTNAIPVVAGNLSYDTYGASNIGNDVTLTTSGQDVNRQFASIYAGTPVYASFLVKATKVGAADYFFNLGPTVLSSVYKNRVYVRSGSTTSKVQFGISGNGSNIVYTTAEYNVNDTYLLVVKYTFNGPGTTSQLFVNPALNAEPTVAAASVTEASGSPTDIGSVALRQGTGMSDLVLDGLRVGTTYRVVRTGLTCLQPVPAFTATTACVGTATAFTNTSTVVEANATYAWDIDNDGTTDYTTKNVSHTYAKAGVHTATLTITQGQCSDTYAQQVTVLELPTATLSGNSTICAGNTASLTVHLTGVAPWTVGYSADGGKTTTSVAVAAADVNADGNYALVVSPAATTTYSLTAVADGNCTGSALSGTATVTVNTVPVLTLPVVPVTDAMTDLRGATVAFAATATGSTPAPKLTYSILLNGVATPITSPYVFPIGTTTVTATATNDCGTTSQTFPVTVKSPTTVTVLYQNADGQVANNTIKPNLQLVNNSKEAIPYSELTVRYWLTAEDAATIAATIDWAQVGAGAVKARYVALAQPAQGAFGYVEYSFTTAAGTLAAGGNSGAIQSRIAKQTQTNFNEADDYSYGPNSAYQLNSRITVYRGTTLMGGVEPTLVAPTTSVQVLTQNTEKKATSNTISTYLQLRNTGSQPIKYQDLTVRYWFTPEGTQTLNSYIDYAQLGSNNVSITFGKAGTQTYAELRFAAALGTLAPLSNTGNVQYRLAKADWSSFTLTNDFSYLAAASALAENTRITVYQQGQLIYGQEPAGATALTSARVVYNAGAGLATEVAPAQALSSFPNPFAASTTLAFTLAQAQAYRLEVYDVSGRLLKQLQAGQAEAGQPVVVQWDAAGLAAGFYMVRLTAGTEVQTLKLIRQ